MEVYSTNFDVMKMFLVYVAVFVAVSFGLPKVTVGQTKDVVVHLEEPSGPFFVGDIGRFVCHVVDNQVNLDEPKWFFELDNGNREDALDQQDNEGSSSKSNDAAGETNFMGHLRITSHNVKYVGCKIENFEHKMPITVQDLQPVPKYIDLCDKASDKPQIILERFRDDFGNQLWAPHFVSDKDVEFSKEVSRFRLSCIASEPVNWKFQKLLKYISIRSNNKTNPKTGRICQTSVLEVTPVEANSTQMYKCVGSDSTTLVRIDAKKASKDSRWDIAQAEQCINLILEILHGGEGGGNWGTGFGIGGSALSLLMLFGIVFLKRKLNNQTENGSRPSSNNNGSNCETHAMNPVNTSQSSDSN